MRAKNRKFRNLALKRTGFSLVELMISVALGSVIVAGLGALFVDISKIQSQASTQAALSQVSAQLKAAIADTAAWNNTIAVSLTSSDNAILSCAAQPTPTCVPSTFSTDPLSYSQLNVILDAGNNLVYRDDTSTGRGYNYQGAPCTGFSTTTPTDSCPFSYRLRVQYSCPLATSCLVPQATVYGILQYAPTGSTFRAINLAKYSFQIVKGVNTSRNDVIQVSETSSSNTGSPAGTTCSSTGTPRVFNTMDMDSACTSATANCNILQQTPLKLKAGTYVCYANAQGYGVDAFTISVNKNLAPLSPAVVSAVFVAASLPIAALETATLSSFTVSDPNDFFLDIVQKCQSPGPSPWALGLPFGLSTTGYDKNIFAGLSCTRIL